MTDHKKFDSDIDNVDGFIKSSSSKIYQNSTTCGCKLLVEWKDGSVDWVPLMDLKKSNPVELAEYVVENEISDEPALNWWVKDSF